MKLPGILTKRLKYQRDISYVFPSSIAATLIFLIITLIAIFGQSFEAWKNYMLLGISLSGGIYVVLQTLFIAPRIQKYRSLYIWINAIISSLGLSLLSLALDESHHVLFDVLLILAVISLAIFSGRRPTYFLVIFSEFVNILAHRIYLKGLADWTIYLIPLLASIVIAESSDMNIREREYQIASI